MPRALIDATRAARLLRGFLRQNLLALTGPELALTIIDFSHDAAADALCRRAGSSAAMDLMREPREVRALLSWRLMVILDHLDLHPEGFPSFGMLGSIDDKAARAFLFESVVAHTRLPASANGQIFSSEKPKWLN